MLNESTVIVVNGLGTWLHIPEVPLWITALYLVVCVRLLYETLLLILAIGVHVANGETDCSHLSTLPVLPVRVTEPPLLPLHTRAAGAVVPGTVPGKIVVVCVKGL